jgi:cytochrome c oxidase subunit 2
VRFRDIFDDVFTMETTVAAVVFALVLGAVLVTVVLRRSRAGIAPSPRTKLDGLELTYLAGLGAIAAFLVVWTTLQNSDEHDAPRHPDVRVKVTAFQWCWQFTHRPESAHPVVERGNCRRRDALPTLVVPTGETVKLNISSNDVIHSFWVPALRYKADAFPHHVNSFTLTLDHEGEWIGRCAEFCGNRHWSMDFRVRAVSPEQYRHYLSAHSASGTAQAAA